MRTTRSVGLWGVASVVALALFGPACGDDRPAPVGSASAAVSGSGSADALADRYGLAADAIDLSKPVQLAVFDPKKHGLDPLVVVVRVASKDKLLAGAKGTPKPDAGDGLIGWGASYARVEGEVAMISQDKDLLVKHASFLRELAAASSGGGVTCVVPMQHIGALYGKDIEALSSQATAMTPPDQAKTLEQTFSFMKAALTELEHVSINLAPTDDGLSLDIGATPTSLSTWRLAFGALRTKGDSKLLTKLPKDSVAVATANFPPETRPLFKKYLEWVGSLPGGGGVDGALSAWEESWDALSGDLAFSVFELDGKPVTIGITGVTDPAKVRDAQRKVAEKVTQGPQSDELKKLKVKISFKKAAYKIGDVEVDVTKTEFGAPPPGMESFVAWLGETHGAVTPTESIVAYGPSAKAVLEAYIGGKLPGGFDGSPAMARAKKSAVKDAVATFTMTPDDVAAMFGLPVPRSDAPPLTISLGTSDGTLHLGVDLPASQLSPIAVMFGALTSRAGGGPGGGAAPGNPKKL